MTNDAVDALRELVEKWRSQKVGKSKPPAFGVGIVEGLKIAAEELAAEIARLEGSDDA